MSGESDFLMIRPLTITNANLTSSSVSEPDVGSPSTEVAYDPAKTDYALGAIVYSATTHRKYESLVLQTAANPLPVPPATSTSFWLDISATNKWSMFDAVYGSQTTKADTIVVVITPGQIVNSVFLGNIDAASVTVAQTVSGYSSTVSLNSHDVLDWYAWYYEDVIRKHDYAFLDIPPYSAGVLTITIDNTGDTAACGICVVGKSVKLGTTQWGMRGGVISYSGTSTDTFGNTTFVPRANAKKLNLDVHIASGFESEAHRLLSLYLDTPIAFIGTSEYAIAQVWGSIANFDVPVSDTGETAPLEIRGLT